MGALRGGVSPLLSPLLSGMAASTPSDPLAKAQSAALRHPLVMMVVGAGASLLVTFGASRVELNAMDRRVSEAEARLKGTDVRFQAVEAVDAAQAVRLATLETAQSGLQRSVDQEMAGVRRGLELLRRAVEKIADAPATRRASYR